MPAPKNPYRSPVLTGLPLVHDLDRAIKEDSRNQQAILKEAGLSVNLFNIWKRGESGPTLMSINCLAQVLGYRLKLEPVHQSNCQSNQKENENA